MRDIKGEMAELFHRAEDVSIVDSSKITSRTKYET